MQTYAISFSNAGMQMMLRVLKSHEQLMREYRCNIGKEATEEILGPEERFRDQLQEMLAVVQQDLKKHKQPQRKRWRMRWSEYKDTLEVS